MDNSQRVAADVAAEGAYPQVPAPIGSVWEVQAHRGLSLPKEGASSRPFLDHPGAPFRLRLLTVLSGIIRTAMAPGKKK